MASICVSHDFNERLTTSQLYRPLVSGCSIQSLTKVLSLGYKLTLSAPQIYL